MTKNFITLGAAVQMTTLYRQEKENILAAPFKGLNILPICETFDKEAFAHLLGETGCQYIRIYYGMTADLKIHAIAVGADSSNQDILPTGNLAAAGDDDPVIVEEATRCPDDCYPGSPLNP